MKTFLLAAVFAAITAAPSFAQNAPPPPGPMASMSPAQRQQMRANFTQMRQLHEQFRTQVLGDLSPSHRALLSQIAGQIATASDPRSAYDSGVQRLDAALSAGEKQRILAAASSMRSKMIAMRKNMPHFNRPHRSGNRRARPRHTMTAGRILMMLTGSRGHGI